jgi:glycosyltransferase involved in cell wall biosynthesis
MDIAIQPSAPAYACPMKIVEYMGMGKCIVAPDQPNVRELLEPGVTGALFPPGGKMGLQRALIELVENPEMRTRLGRQAYEKLNERGLLWTKNAEKVISLLGLENQKFKGELSVASAAGVGSQIRG